MKQNKAPATAKNLRPGPVSPRHLNLRNSVPLFMIKTGSQPVTRIDIMFRAGTWWQDKPLVASSANGMLTEGTAHRSGEETANIIDYYGAYLNTSADKDNAFISLYSLTRHLGHLLPLVEEIVKTPSFPERELETLLERRLQSYMIERNRVGSMAREHFASALFGPGHPYGYTPQPEDFRNIRTGDLIEFHRRRYISDNCAVFITGNYDEDIITGMIDRLFGDKDWSGTDKAEITHQTPGRPPGRKILAEKKDAVQSALRIGRTLFTRKHPHFAGMMVLNSILGGHFGSRLMQNIREKRGYTYGIGSVIAGLRHSGFMAIVSEVGAVHRKQAVKEIYNELDKLRNKPVSKRELDLTRNIMMGEILRSFDGPFAWLESIRNLVEHDLDTGFIDKVVETVNGITPAGLQDLAEKYLVDSDMIEVVAGQ